MRRSLTHAILCDPQPAGVARRMEQALHLRLRVSALKQLLVSADLMHAGRMIASENQFPSRSDRVNKERFPSILPESD